MFRMLEGKFLTTGPVVKKYPGKDLESTQDVGDRLLLFSR